MARVALAACPPQVVLRLHLFLGVQLGPIFAYAARFAVPAAVVAHARAQLELVELFLRTNLRCPFALDSSPLRRYVALCKTIVDAVSAPLLSLTQQDIFYPGIIEPARADLVLLRYWDTSTVPGPPLVLRPPPQQRLDLSNYLPRGLGLSSHPLQAWIDLNAADTSEFQNLLAVLDLLDNQDFSYEFYHPDHDAGRQARAYLNFNICGIRGTLIVEEPAVDAE